MENADLTHLSPSEYEKIITVLKRDRELRSQQEMHIQQLKKDLAYLRRRAALRPGVDADRCCARCLEVLGRILNRGALCPLCHKKICKSCRRFSSPTPQCDNDDNIPSSNGTTFLTNLRQARTGTEHEWLCVVCHKRMQLKAVSGEWMEEYSASSQKKAKTSPGDQLRRVLHETQRKSLFIEQKEKSISTFDLSHKSPPAKPPRTFLHSPDASKTTPEKSKPNIETMKKVKSVAETSGSECMAVDKMKVKSASVSSEDTASPRPSPRISPWNGIEVEPKIPLRSLKGAASFGHLMSIDYSTDPWNHGENHPSDDTHSMVSLHSQSTGSEIADDLQNVSLFSKSRKKVSPLKKQHAVPEPSATIDSLQHSSLDTTDSGIFSPGLKSEETLSCGMSPHSPLRSAKSDYSPIKVSNDDSDVSRSPLLSTKSESDAHCSSEISDLLQSPFPHLTMSDASSSEEEPKSPKVTKRVVFKKRKQSTHKELPKRVESKLRSKKEQGTINDESGNSLRSSPHGRMRIRHRTLSGGSEDGRKRESLPQISVSECNQLSASGTLSSANFERDSLGRQDDDADQMFTYQCRSQMSLSSYGGRSESVTSVYSAAGGGRYGTVTVSGEVYFSLKYNYKASVFEVHIKECHNLAPVDIKRNRSDPYVKVYLLPDRTKSGKRKTKVKKHTLNPIFDELLKFQVTVSELEKRILWLSVWHSDRFGRNDFLGEVILELSHENFENAEMKCYPLQERTETFDAPVSYKGDIILALKYVPPDVTSRKPNKKQGGPSKGSLHILIREARNLMATRSNGTSDPFCKSYLLPDKSKAGKQKTSVFKKTCNPKWNHTFVYEDVTVEDLKERCLELTIWDYDKITSNDFLGGVRLCLGTGKHQGRDVEWMDSSGEEVSLWYTMIERPNTWVDGSLLLRPNMQNRKVP